MSDGIKIALGIGAVAVVGYFVIQAINKPPAVIPKGTAPSGTTTAFISGIIQGIGGLFKNSPSTNAPANAPLAGIVYGQGYSYNGETLNAGSAADNVQISPGSED